MRGWKGEAGLLEQRGTLNSYSQLKQDKLKAIAELIRKELSEWDAEMNTRLTALSEGKTTRYDAPPMPRILQTALLGYFEISEEL